MTHLRPRQSPLTRAATLPFVIAIYAYRITLGPFLGGQCRFHPTCSQYALDAYREHGPLRATLLTLRRLARCHPFARGGFDPAPLRSEPPTHPGS
ncbi:MAG TPA: membrane protein insertion efficiency factor YidD [Phycisphaerales bacterium]|nr:membrane protein insertion efficiency factor YidD [Phycisphaerales bacterium]